MYLYKVFFIIKKGLSWTPMLYMYIPGVFPSSVGEARQVAMVMIIDVRKIIAGNLSRYLKKRTGHDNYWGYLKKAGKKYFYQKLFMNTET